MMIARAFVSRFSPNRTDPAVLEAIFVQRHNLANAWLERLRDSLLTEVKHHLLAIGPRGCGKSHLVALLVGRLRSDPVIREQARIAWLPEDETTPSFWKFLLRILRALNAEYGDAFPAPPREQLADASDDRRSKLLIDHLLKCLDGKRLLVVVENLDDVLEGLKSEGQKRWRAFLQEHPVVATLATAQRLTKDISSRDRPFFNFFQLEHLRPLSAEEALQLLQKIAEQRPDPSLVSFLGTAAGRARVRAIRHIAGGSHRVFIILSEFVTRESLDELVTAFEELLDELTPYYQERLRWLPDQQREIIEFLCRQNRTVQVKAIASELFISDQTVAAQLKSLRDKGYVTSASVGRESRYELAEPLMRLCVEVKDPQREPIRLIVEFLRVWYDREPLEAPRERTLPDAIAPERRTFQLAMAEAFMLQGRWGEAGQVLSQHFGQLTSQPKAAHHPHLDALISTLFRADGDARVKAIWLRQIVQQAGSECFCGNRSTTSTSTAVSSLSSAVSHPLTHLSLALVRSLNTTAYDGVTAHSLNTWAAAWEDAAKDQPHLSFAASLFSVGVKYLYAKDEKVLLDLVQEERAVLRELFGLDDVAEN